VEDLFDIRGDGTLVVRLHVQPGAGRTTVTGRHGDALKVSVAAPPEKGRANAAVERLVAASLGVPASAVTVVGGASSRQKRVAVSGVEAGDARRLLGALLETRRPDGGNAGARGGVARGRR
jgi:uncharacterized protein